MRAVGQRVRATRTGRVTLKVIIALLGAGVASVITIVNDAWTFDSYLIVGLAVLNAAIAHFGVAARIDGVKEVLADSTQDDSKVIAIDPVVVRIADHQLNPTVGVKRAA